MLLGWRLLTGLHFAALHGLLSLCVVMRILRIVGSKTSSRGLSVHGLSCQRRSEGRVWVLLLILLLRVRLLLKMKLLLLLLLLLLLVMLKLLLLHVCRGAHRHVESWRMNELVLLLLRLSSIHAGQQV